MDIGVNWAFYLEKKQNFVLTTVAWKLIKFIKLCEKQINKTYGSIMSKKTALN
jgi:hypothetical protein